MEFAQLQDGLAGDARDGVFRRLYGGSPEAAAFQQKRYARCLEAFAREYGAQGDIRLLSVPGRSEVGGNHTDHNHGRVLACAVDLDIIAAARATEGSVVRVHSEGFETDVIDLDGLSPREDERNTSAALIRGVCARLRQLGWQVGGFDAFTSSRVLKGSGLSSSAAFEVMVAAIVSHLYNGGRIRSRWPRRASSPKANSSASPAA